jgi:hypothetical protein
LRRVVLIAGIAAAVFGFVMILALPVAPLWRVSGAVLWLLTSGREILLIAKGHKRCQHIRIEHNGDMQVTAPNGRCSPATLRAGSVVLSRIAWLRFESQSGQQFAELMRGQCWRNKDWRRLQVIWRHLGAGR